MGRVLILCVLLKAVRVIVVANWSHASRIPVVLHISSRRRRRSGAGREQYPRCARYTYCSKQLKQDAANLVHAGSWLFYSNLISARMRAKGSVPDPLPFIIMRVLLSKLICV